MNFDLDAASLNINIGNSWDLHGAERHFRNCKFAGGWRFYCLCILYVYDLYLSFIEFVRNW